MELMIGDWVKVTDDWTDDSFIGQVKAIDELENVNVTEDEDVAYPYSIDCLEPIPLTPEILEKNLFIIGYDEKYRMYHTYVGKAHIVVDYLSDGVVRIDIHNELPSKDTREEADLVTFTRIWHKELYVHELQHALKLCGIEKEIKI